MLALHETKKGESMPSSIARNWLLVALVGMYSIVGQAAELSPVASVQAENLVRESIAGIEGKEVIVSRVSFPPHTEIGRAHV